MKSDKIKICYVLMHTLIDAHATRTTYGFDTCDISVMDLIDEETFYLHEKYKYLNVEHDWFYFYFPNLFVCLNPLNKNG